MCYLIGYNKLLVFIPIHLLNTEYFLDIPTDKVTYAPHPKVEQEPGAVAKYLIVTEYIALKSESSKFTFLEPGEAGKCKADALETCTS